MKTFALNTSNKGKLQEFQRLFSKYGAKLTATEIDLKEISKIGSKMDIDGLQHLKKMDKKDKDNSNSKDNKEKQNEE